jgi:hypothetical protein
MVNEEEILDDSLKKEKLPYRNEMVDEWFQALEELMEKSPHIYQELEDYSNREWLASIRNDLISSKTTLTLIENYLKLLSDKKVIQKDDFNVKKDDKKVIIEIKSDTLSIIRRGKMFSFLIENILGTVFEATEKETPENIIITLSPGKYTLRAKFSYKVRKGSVKVSDKDMEKLDMGIIEEVLISHIDKETGMHEMMFAESKVPTGVVFMNISDANSIGLKEGDRVKLTKIHEESTEEDDNQEDEIEEEQKPDEEAPEEDGEKPEEVPKDDGEEEEPKSEDTVKEETEEEPEKPHHKAGYKHEEHEKKKLEHKISEARGK